MRNYLLFLLMACFGQLSGQTAKTVQADDIYQIVDRMPFFPGCSEFEETSEEKRACSNRNLIVYISDYLHYPEKARALGIEGTVYLSFVISETGRVTEPKIVRDIGGGCGEVAFQIVKNMPRWEPGKLRGKPVKVMLNLPVKFSLKNAKNNNTPEAQIAWGNLAGSQVSKNRLLENFEEEIVVRDLSGKPLGITRLIFASKKGKKIKEAESRGAITGKMKKLVKNLNRKSEFAILATVQMKGKFVDVERIFQIRK